MDIMSHAMHYAKEAGQTFGKYLKKKSVYKFLVLEI